MGEELAVVQIEYRLNCMVRELDELVLMAANPETVDLIHSNLGGLCEVLDRCRQIGSHLYVQARRAA